MSETENGTINGARSEDAYNLLVENKYSEDEIYERGWTNYFKNMLDDESIFTEQDFKDFNKENVIATVSAPLR